VNSHTHPPTESQRKGWFFKALKRKMTTVTTSKVGVSFSGILLHVPILLVLLPAVALSLSSSNGSIKSLGTSRRQNLSHFAKFVMGAIVFPTVPLLQVAVQEASAACLPGDLSPDCIGVYKIPLQDALSSTTLNTPEALSKNAPDVNFIYVHPPPKSVQFAKDMLLAQRAAADDIRQVVQDGKLQEAGIKVLNLIPKITGAGITIQQQVQSTFPVADSGANQLRVMKFQQQLQDLITLWSQIDVEIGQALRGQMGVSAVAQIQILGSLKDATVAFDEFLICVDANTP
jgi:hypothetical protein